MGIPSYFSYIIKNYANIIRNLRFFTSNNDVKFDHLYLDCNSIIYDSVRALEQSQPLVRALEQSQPLVRALEQSQPGQPVKPRPDFEDAVIKSVIEKLHVYVGFIRPTKTLHISFDGVAPFAKMDQQRTRRYKSHFLSANSVNTVNIEGKEPWNTAAITPGTQFMNKLSKRIKEAFANKEKVLKINNIIVSGSDKPGEGEHKMFEHLRNLGPTTDNVAVYGLDADLIMLSIFHLKYTKNIFIFRETPEFFKHMIPVEAAPNEPHFLDIHQLSVSILCEMNVRFSDPYRINDYVFLCFFLGNDFLPHFPAMNIRTHGITALLDIYRKIIGNHKDRYLITPTTNQLNWPNIGLFIKEIAKNEKQLLANEYHVRKKYDRFTYSEKTPEERDDILLNAPIIYRADEKYICPDEPYWEQRYYKVLFEPNPPRVDAICRNYYEGLEWVYTYYNSHCPDWRWKYHYHYPPLFADLCKHVPKPDTALIPPNNNRNPVPPYVQLSYVLPRSQLGLLPPQIEQLLVSNHGELYPLKYGFKWAFCRYFWEAHPILPEITLDFLEEKIDGVIV